MYNLKKLAALACVVDKTNLWVAKAMAILILPLLTITIYGVVMRYLFAQPISWGGQALLLLFVPVAVLSGGYVLSVDAHIRLDLIYSRWGPRGQAISSVVTFPAFLLFTTMLAMTTIQLAWDSTVIGETYGVYAFHGPVYPKKIAVAIGVVLLLIQSIVEFARNVHTIRKGTHTNSER